MNLDVNDCKTKVDPESVEEELLWVLLQRKFHDQGSVNGTVDVGKGGKQIRLIRVAERCGMTDQTIARAAAQAMAVVHAQAAESGREGASVSDILRRMATMHDSKKAIIVVRGSNTSRDGDVEIMCSAEADTNECATKKTVDLTRKGGELNRDERHVLYTLAHREAAWQLEV